jgi:hypothetical protein
MVSEHPCNIQLLQDQHVGFFENSVDQLVLPILPLTSNMQVKARQLQSQCPSSPGTFPFPCQLVLQMLNFHLGDA